LLIFNLRAINDLRPTPKPIIEGLPTVSAAAPDWQQLCRELADQKQEFRLVDVTTKRQVAQAVDLVVQHRMWIKDCDGGFLVTKV
jgi:hypothetical protein